jgi:acetyltransferase-like isoleucine patch superfamily enzyme
MGEGSGQGLIRRWRDLQEEPLRRVALEAAALRPRRRRQFHHFGGRSVLHRPQWLYGPQHMSIGQDVLILHGAWLAVEKPAWLSASPSVLRIGDRTVIRPGVTISAAVGIDIGPDVLMGGGVSIIDSDHTWRGGGPHALYNPLEVAPISIGAGTWLAEKAVVLRGSVIGKGCLVAAGAVVRGGIPDHSVAAGVPARVVGDTSRWR